MTQRDMTQRLEHFLQFDSNGWTFLLNMTQRIEPFYFMTLRVEPFYWIWLKELNLFLSITHFFLSMTKRKELSEKRLKELIFFFLKMSEKNEPVRKKSSNNWTFFFAWLTELNLCLEIWLQELNSLNDSSSWTSFYDSWNWTLFLWIWFFFYIEPFFFNTTQRIEIL